MRLPYIVALVAVSLSAFADTIYLRNGRTISAEEVWEEDGRVFYRRGDDRYAIPKTLVERIEQVPLSQGAGGPQPVGTAAAHSEQEIAGFALSASVPGMDAVPDLIRDGRVNADTLAALERAGRNEPLAAAYFVAGRHEQEHGELDRARYYLGRAVAHLPGNATLLNHYAAVLVQLDRTQEAISTAERSTRLAPADPEGYFVLGFAYYRADRDRDAIPAWKRGLQLRSNDRVQAMLDKAERELSAESAFQQSETRHFVIKYEGATTPLLLRQQIEQSLEGAYNELVLELGIAPGNAISVSLYNNQTFFDVTQAPAWIGALNDGKLRVPIQGVREVTPALQRVLKHELAHSFIEQATRGRCPQWLNEGIAQIVEPKTLGRRGSRLAQLYREQRQIPLHMLERSFFSLSSDEAALVYDQALAAAEYIRESYGPGALRSLLERLADGGSVDNALRSTIHAGYERMEEEITSYLGSRYK